MANDTIGRVQCPRHGRAEVWGEVSKNKNGRLYYRCGTPDKKWRDGCGLVDDAGENFQEWMLEHAEFFAPGDSPEAIEQISAVTVSEPQPEVIPMPEAKPIKEKVVVVSKEKKPAPEKKPAGGSTGDLVDGDYKNKHPDATGVDDEDWLL